MKRIRLTLAASLIVAVAACGDSSGPPPDVGGNPDGIVLPDSTVDLTVDGSFTPDLGADSGGVLACSSQGLGDQCTGPQDCAPDQQCLGTLAGGGGICVCSCNPDNPATQFEEDNCPDLANNRCATVETQQGDINVCLRLCQPTTGQDTCPGNDIKCTIGASQLTPGGIDASVCISGGCGADSDCPILNGIACDPSAPTDPCATGTTCVSTSASVATQGECALEGVCDVASGNCTERSSKPGTFNAAATVGSPCASDLDCPANAQCLSEQAGQGGAPPNIQNGYCISIGCSFDQTFTSAACDSGSACFPLFVGGFCLKTCDVQDGSTCRGLDNGGGTPLDGPYAYECQAWNNLQIGGVPVVPAPICIWTQSIPCSIFGTSPTAPTCASLGFGQTNPTNMDCRDLNGVPTADDRDPNGFCVDDTNSDQLTSPGDAGVDSGSSPDAGVGDAGTTD